MTSKCISGFMFVLMMAAPACAQDVAPFTGFHAGAAATAVDHHFVIEETTGGATTSRNVTQWGAGGMVFAGYDTQIAPHVIAGVEGAFMFGGKSAFGTTSTGQAVGFTPRHGYSATARLGVVAAPRLLVFGKGGYGQHYYRETVPAGVGGSLDTTGSFVLGGGLEYGLGLTTAIRAEFEHLDGTRNQFALGMLLRF